MDEPALPFYGRIGSRIVEDPDGVLVHRKLLSHYIDWIMDDDNLVGSRLRSLQEKLDPHVPVPNQDQIDESYRRMVVYESFMNIEKQKVIELIQNET